MSRGTFRRPPMRMMAVAAAGMLAPSFAIGAPQMIRSDAGYLIPVNRIGRTVDHGLPPASFAHSAKRRHLSRKNRQRNRRR